MYLLGVAIVFLCIELYRRYFPVKGISCKTNVDEGKDTIVLDIRDYNDKGVSTKVAMQIPYAYLKRYSSEIPYKSLHVVAANRIELNLGLRFLLKKGYHVSSFEILNCPCIEKGGVVNGI
ncbi:sulfurtransferase [Terrilactibacillus sp. BCM23-1]|uniref:Sulfurtransferase n=1 Tax=Terrilactibacillus tamarindi TaxID=2599694 RepID=A0A6N8CSY9_9BACI|nr:sulfurtransferase [Terrilactibacillus tamarindi]